MEVEREKECKMEENLESISTFHPNAFVKRLLSGKDEIEALKDFKKWTQESKDGDVVLQFLREVGSSDGGEFLNLFAVKRPPSELAVIFEALEAIFLRIADDLNDYQSWAIALIRRLIEPNVMRNVYHSLAMTNTSREIKATIRFLTSMVLVNNTTAKAVSSRFNFDIILPLLSRINIKDSSDVRASTIHFLLSFLLCNEDALIQHLLNQKRILNSIFPDLIHDKASTIRLVLNTLKSQVIEKRSISKTSKTSLFNAYTLKFVFDLFNWVGPKVYQKKKRNAPKLTAAEKEVAPYADSVHVPNEDDVSTVHQLTHEFLIAVCCSYKNGIVFLDKSIGTSKRNQNHVITDLLSRIGKPYEVAIVEKTVIEIMKACPDQMIHYMPTLKEALLPRPSGSWIIAINFLIKILNAHDLIRIIKIVYSPIPPMVLVNVLLNVTVSSLFTREVLQNSVRHGDFSVRENILQYIDGVLKRAVIILREPDKEMLTILQRKSNLPVFRKKFAAKLTEFLPGIDDLLFCWSLETDSFTSSTIKQVAPIMPKCHLVYEELFIHLQLVINVIHAYVKIFPDVLPNCVDTLLLGVNNVKDRLVKMQLCEIQIKVFHLLASFEIDRFLLTKKINNKPIVSLLCEIISTSHGSDIQIRAIQIMQQLLVATGLFQSVEYEVDIWLRSFQNANNSDIANFFPTILIDFISNSQMYLDLTSDAIVKAASVSTKNDMGLCSKIFDEILNESCMENGNVDFMPSADFGLPQISAMVVALLKSLEKISVKSNTIKEFVISVLYDILHCQHHPDIFCRILLQYHSVLPKECLNYLQHFISFDQNASEIEGPCTNDCITLDQCKSLTEICRLMYEKKFLIDGAEEHFRLLKDSSSTEEICIVVQQILLYLKLLLHGNKEESMDLVNIYCKLLNVLLNKSEPRYIKSKDHICNNNNSCVHKMDHLILRHPIVLDAFLHPKLHETNSSAGALWELTKLALILLTKILPGEKPEASIFVMKDKMEKFMLTRLNLSRKSSRDECEADFSFIGIIEPFLSYLEPNIIEIFVDTLCKSPIQRLFTQEISKLQFTEFGNLLIFLLNYVVEANSTTTRPILNSTQILQCANLYIEIMQCESICEEESGMKCSIKDTFGTTLLHLLESHGLYAFILNNDFLKVCLEDVNSATSRMLSDVLVRKNLNNLSFCFEWALNSKIFEDNLPKYMDLIIHVLDGVRSRNCYPFSENHRRSLKGIRKLYWPLLLEKLLPTENVDKHPELEIEKACNLLQSFSELNVIGSKLLIKFAERCLETSRLSEPLSSHILLSTQKLFTAQSCQETLIDDKHVVVLYVILCLRVILNADMSSEENVMDIIEQNSLINAIVAVLENDQPLPFLGKIIHQEKLWHNLVKIALKVGLRDEKGTDMLILLKAIINRLLQNKELVSYHASLVFDLILGHSQFLPGILNTSVKAVKWKETLIDLLLLLAKIEPSVVSKIHIPIYLASYSASMSKVDQKLLMLIYFYEKHGVDVHSYRPFIWGKPAIEHYAVLKNLSQSLLKQPSMEEVLKLLDNKKLLNTALHFPLTLKLKMENGVTNENDKLGMLSPENMYDPRFILSLFSCLLAPESLVHCYEFINCNGLAFVFSTLGSNDSDMRAVGYHLLTNFYQHLAGAGSVQKVQWLCLLDSVRNAIETPNAKLTNIITVFLIKTCSLLLKPTNNLVKPIAGFLFMRPVLDIWNVPDFYSMFFNPNILLHNGYRNWILTVISKGLRSTSDYRICQKRYIFKIILGYYISPTADHASKLLILDVMKAAVKMRPVVIDLFSHQGILSVIHTMIKKSNPELLSELIDILHNSWKTLIDVEDRALLIEKEKSFFEMAPFVINMPTATNKMDGYCSFLLSSELLMTLLTVAESINVDTSINVFAKYLATLSSVLRYIRNGSKLSQDQVECATTLLVKRLLHLNSFIICKQQMNEEFVECYSELVESEKNDSSNISFEDITKDISSSLMNLEQFLCIKQSQKDLCEVILQWRFDSTDAAVLVSDEPNIKHSDAAVCANVCDTFASACHLLLKSVSLSENNCLWLQRVYSWINDQLLEDRCGVLTTALITDSFNSDIFSHLFKMLELFLSVPSEECSHLHSIHNDFTIQKLDVIVQLCKLFTTLVQNIMNHGYNAVLQRTGLWDSFVAHLFEDKVQDILKLPLSQKLIHALSETDKTVQYKAAVGIATLACELWIQVEEMENFMCFVQQLLNSHTGDLIHNHDLSEVSSNKVKRKSSLKKDSAKKKRSV